MQRILGAACVGALLCGSLARADDEADLKALVAQALKAHGGDNLAKYTAGTLNLRGKFYGLGDGLDFKGTTAFQAPDKRRVEADVDYKGMNYKHVEVVNGDQGWIALNGKVKPMTKEMAAEAREQMYASMLIRQLPLTDADYKLSLLGPAKVAGRAALGVRVQHKDHRDVSLYFDKDNGLLLRSETRVKDIEGGGDKEWTTETIYGDYKEVAGMKVPHKYTIRRDGELFVEAEATDVKPAKKLDESTFASP